MEVDRPMNGRWGISLLLACIFHMSCLPASDVHAQVVVRPVGHTGNLVQVLDGIDGAVIIDKKVLLRSSSWTGLVLMRSERNRLLWVLFLAASLIGVGLLFWFQPRLPGRTIKAMTTRGAE
jgi:hypothetical protein